MSRPFSLISTACLSGLLLSMLLSGCAVGPKYQAPAAGLTSFHNRAATAADNHSSPPPLDRWWTGFNDPTLVTIVERALSENLDLAATLERVNQARAAAGAAGARLYPTGELNVSATAEHQSLKGNLGSIAGGYPTFRRNIHEYAIGPGASWELDLAGGLRHNAAAFRDEVQAVEADRMGSRVVIAADAADAYLQVRGYQARLAIA